MSSLREALKRLEQMGLVDVRHGDAMRVRDWREHGGLDVSPTCCCAGGGLDRGVLGDILEARSLMLRELAGLAAERRDDGRPQRTEPSWPSAFAAAGDDAAAAAQSTSRSSPRSPRPRATSSSS